MATGEPAQRAVPLHPGGAARADRRVPLCGRAAATGLLDVLAAPQQSDGRARECHYRCAVAVDRVLVVQASLSESQLQLSGARYARVSRQTAITPLSLSPTGPHRRSAPPARPPPSPSRAAAPSPSQRSSSTTSSTYLPPPTSATSSDDVSPRRCNSSFAGWSDNANSAAASGKRGEVLVTVCLAGLGLAID